MSPIEKTRKIAAYGGNVIFRINGESIEDLTKLVSQADKSTTITLNGLWPFTTDQMVELVKKGTGKVVFDFS